MGTKSLLFGAHQFLLHPVFLFVAWVKLYGWPKHPAYYVAFVIHDWGYWSLPEMDGERGETHPKWAARWMGRLFGKEWSDFCLYHSRFYAKRDGKPFSRLCVADKLALALTPAWLYLPMVRATGEIEEYMRLAEERTAAGEPRYTAQGQHRGDQEVWFAQVQEYMRRWVAEHKDGRDDTWTPDMGREAATESGVWK